MIFKPPQSVCNDVSSYDTFYSYPLVYYVKPGEPSPTISDVPVHGGLQVESYCVNLGDTRLVLHRIVEQDSVVVEAVDRHGNPVEPAEAIDLLFGSITGSRKAPWFTPHEVRAIAVLFAVDERDVSAILKRNQLVSKLEDRFVAIVGDSVYVFSRNPNVILHRIDDPEAVAVAREASIVSRAPIRDMREHVKSFVSSDRVTVFVDSRVSLWCDKEKCFVVRTTSNVTKLMLRDIDLHAVEVDVSSPKKYRSVDLVLPADYVIISRNVLLLNKHGGGLRVAGTIENAGFSTSAPLMFSRSGFEGYAHVVVDESIAQVKIVKNVQRARTDEETESLTVAL